MARKSKWLRYVVKNPGKYDGRYLYGYYVSSSYGTLSDAKRAVMPGGFVLDIMAGDGYQTKEVYRSSEPFPD